jgi:hypothetical protein
MDPHERFSLFVLVALAAALLMVLLLRVHEGRCQHSDGRKPGLDCSYPAYEMPAAP